MIFTRNFGGLRAFAPAVPATDVEERETQQVEPRDSVLAQGEKTTGKHAA
jgi:hypothetical protein